MTILFTILTCIVLYIVQAWLLPVFSLIFAAVFQFPGHLVVRTIPDGPEIEDFAAEHPWRIHLAALLFRFGCVATAVVGWAIILIALYYLSTRWDSVAWFWVYVLSFLIFLSAFRNACTLNSQYNSLSHRLMGGNSELRYQHGQRDLPPNEVLGPIAVKRHGF